MTNDPDPIHDGPAVDLKKFVKDHGLRFPEKFNVDEAQSFQYPVEWEHRPPVREQFIWYESKLSDPPEIIETEGRFSRLSKFSDGQGRYLFNEYGSDGDFVKYG